ncbi:hypothetical protein BBO99_00002286 [Phytophthora kernoviae]|uniref:Cation efflux protein cytoplasmic domain-containing protein n=2 Tax=Phytophthora kernoviae TaxID=325452 RepID=A0A421GXE7_9STRA|nr:hypothetical protein G195_002702 [Phytophthora kernoviae 00238/432]KAG2528650.1 hypothetical protein JM16_002591 [Phytophthora kernoviae]RLN83279.1 hypothetical protein BBO99_00002286 [Phytophthora kernoviae]
MTQSKHDDKTLKLSPKTKPQRTPLPSLTITVDSSVDQEEVQGPTTHDRIVALEKAEGAQETDKEEEETDAVQSAVKKLQLACLCSFIFMCVQFAGGYYADSLAIMTDAAHLLSDVAGFLVSLFAMYLGQLPASAVMPFGYHRAEVIGALLSVLLIWILTIGLLFTAVRRMIDQGRPDAKETVDGKIIHGGKDCVEQSPSIDLVRTPMSAMALIDGVEEPISCASDGHEAFESINVHAAYIHALGDFLQSLGVCLAGALVWYNPSWQMADPITTVLFSFLVLGTTIGVLKRSIHILMEGAPPELDLRVVEKHLRALPCVYDVHDLHMWMLTEGHLAASVHILPNGSPRNALRGTQRVLASLGVRHQTVQVEDPAERDWNEDLYCTWATFSSATEAESKMSVPRAGTRKAAPEPLAFD